MPRRSKKYQRKTPQDQVEQFLNNTEGARELARKCRDYYDGKQWTDEEIAKLAKRKQAPIVVNRIKPKVNGMLGLLEVRKTDPKAIPRTMREEEFANVVTDALRYVDQKNDMDEVQAEVAENMWVEGYGGAIIDVRKSPKGEVSIKVNGIPWDRIYFDPHSRRKDFKDTRYAGMIMWVDLDDLGSMFPGRKIPYKKLKEECMTQKPDTDETFSDRPRWYTRDSEGECRIRVAMHFRKLDGVWSMSIFVGDTFIIKEVESPYHDEDGVPTNPIELVSGYVDAENNRYGEVAEMIPQQDELNHRRSKYLHQNSTRQTYGNQQAIGDVAKAKKALSIPDGHLELQGQSKFGEDFGIIQTADMSNAQFSLYMDAKNEMDRNGFSAPMAGNIDGKEMSGKALGILQEGSSLELNRQYATLANWKNRVYEQIWWRIKQFWKEEKWIRVTDDYDSLRWVGFNAKIPARKMLEEAANDKRLPPDQRQKNMELLQFLLQTKNPRLNEIVEIKNDTSKLDVDISIEQSFDVVNIQREQLDTIIKFAGQADKQGQIELVDLIELSEIRGKDELIRKITERTKQRQQMAQQMASAKQQEEAKETGAKVVESQARAQNTQADTALKAHKTATTQIENAILLRNPDGTPQVNT